jgi:hypothetical protein
MSAVAFFDCAVRPHSELELSFFSAPEHRAERGFGLQLAAVSRGTEAQNMPALTTSHRLGVA